MKHFELIATTQKSYYRKAFVLQNNDSVYLQSYDTVVCGIENDTFVRFWNGHSVTTMNHVNDFRKAHNLKTLTKKEWLSIPVVKCPIAYMDHVAANMGKYY